MNDNEISINTDISTNDALQYTIDIGTLSEDININFPLSITSNSYVDTYQYKFNDVEFDGEIIWKGRNLGNIIESIEKRLSILVPDHEKLEKYSALKKAYENYKMLEKLLYEENSQK